MATEGGGGDHPHRREDIAWAHGVPLGNNKSKSKCNYCGKKIMSGGATRLKAHLAGGDNNVASCPYVPPHVKESMKTMIQSSSHRRAQKRVSREFFDEAVLERRPGKGHGEDDDDRDSDSDMYADVQSRSEAEHLRAATAASRQTFEDEQQRDYQRARGAGGSRPPAAPVAGGSGAGGSRRGGQLPYRRTQSVRGADEDEAVEILRQDAAVLKDKGPKQKKLKHMWGQWKTKVGDAVSKWFFFHGIPAHATSSPYYRDMLNTVGQAGDGVTGPNAYELMNVYLPRQKKELDEYITELKERWPVYGVTVMCDGWTGPTRQSLINFMVYCDGKTIFLKSVDASSETKDAKYIYKLLKEVVEDVGIDNVVQVVTDNGANFKKAGEKLMNNKKYRLFWTPCTAHCIDLMLKDMGKRSLIQGVVDRVRNVSTFIYNHGHALQMLREKCGGDLVRPGITRFATNYIALKSFEAKKPRLRAMFASTEWFAWRGSDTPAGRAARETINSEGFWHDVKKVVTLLEPLVKVLRMVDSEKKPTLPHLYAAIDMMKRHVHAAIPRGGKRYLEIIQTRWEKMLMHPMHKAAYYLNPKYQYKCKLGLVQELVDAVQVVVEKLEPNSRMQSKCNQEIKTFRDALGSFGRSAAIDGRAGADAAEWWFLYGGDAPNLRKIAQRVLSQTSSASGCERNWSTFSLIHSKKRNRLGAKRLDDLVYIHYNMRLKMQHIRQGIYDENNDKDTIELSTIFEADSDDEDPLVDWVRDRQPVMDQEGGRPDPEIAQQYGVSVDAFMSEPEGRQHSQAPRPFEDRADRIDEDEPESEWSDSDDATQAPDATQAGGDDDDDGGDDDGDGGDDDGDGGDDDGNSGDDDGDGGDGGDGSMRERYAYPGEGAASPVRFTGETQFTHATQDRDHGARTPPPRGYSRGPRSRFVIQKDTVDIDVSNVSDSFGGMSLGEFVPGRPEPLRAPSFIGTSSSEHSGFGPHFGGYGQPVGSSLDADSRAPSESSFVDSLFSYPAARPSYMPAPPPDTSSIFSGSSAGSSRFVDVYPRLGYLQFVEESVYRIAVEDFDRIFRHSMSWPAFVIQSEERYRRQILVQSRGAMDSARNSMQF